MSAVEISGPSQYSFTDTESHPIAVSFNQISYSVQIPEAVDPKAKKPPCSGGPEKIDKTILHQLHGTFQPGKFTAIMGASGAGKTTLLNVIAGEAAGGRIDGEILVNGAAVDTDTMKRISAFVFQDDVILTSMTVKEAITLSARLRLPKSMSDAERTRRVHQVIEILHLHKCADTVIGSPTDQGGISGGERKRCAIGMELITNPSVLFLDEPTTGLDTYTAYSVIDTLAQLAASGRTVVATIHQPSSDIFHLFDNLLVLSDGHILYQGSARESVEWFNRLRYVCSEFTNPADHIFMKVLNDIDAEERGDAHKVKKQLDDLKDHYQKSPVATAMKDLAKIRGEGIDAKSLATRPGMGTQISSLCARNLKHIIRNPMGLRARFGQAVMMGVIVALIFNGVEDNQAGVQGRTGMLFFTSMAMMMNAFGVLSVFSSEKVVFEREQSLGMYTTASFFIAKIITELPHNIAFPILQSTIAYWSTGLQNDAGKFVIFFTTFTMNFNAGGGLGILVASLFSDVRIALVVAPPMILPLMIFSGFFINTESIPPYFDWIKYLSPIKYAFEAFVLNEFTGLPLKCDPEELQVNVNCPPGERCFCPVQDGEQVIRGFGMEDDLTITENLLCLLALWFGYLLVAFLSLANLVRKREKARAKVGKAKNATPVSSAVN